MEKSCLLVICAAPLARRAIDVARVLVDDGWTVIPVATPAAAEGWVDAEGIQRVTGLPLKWDTAQEQPGVDPRDAEAVIVCPATFNTINKLSLGIADNYALSLLAEALGRGRQMTITPFVNESLWRHPRFAASLAELVASGVSVVDPTGHESPRPLPHGSGQRAADSFIPGRLARHLIRPASDAT